MARDWSRKTQIQARLKKQGALEILKAVQLQGPLPDKSGSGGYKNINVFLLMKMASSMSKPVVGMSMSALIAGARWIRSELYAWIISYSERETSEGLGYQQFRQDWKTIRSWVPLQVRLAAEQVFFDLGAPYTELITGFKPIK